MTREPLRFERPHPIDCACTYCRKARKRLQPRAGSTAQPSTPEDGQIVQTPEQGRPITTRED